jgi:hypothetical protein
MFNFLFVVYQNMYFLGRQKCHIGPPSRLLFLTTNASNYAGTNLRTEKAGTNLSTEKASNAQMSMWKTEMTERQTRQ